MGKAKWWVCDDCKSLNDLPANKCFNCRSPKPSNPVKIDDQYSQVAGGSSGRVGVSVDLSKVGDLTRPDPIETADGGGIIEAYNFRDDFSEDQPLESYRHRSLEPTAPPPPLREPKLRSIAEAGGLHWEETYQGLGAPPPQGQPAGSPPPGTPPAGVAPGTPPAGVAPGEPSLTPNLPGQPPGQMPPGQMPPGHAPAPGAPAGSGAPPPYGTPPPQPGSVTKAPSGGPRPSGPPSQAPTPPGAPPPPLSPADAPTPPSPTRPPLSDGIPAAEDD